MSVRKNARYIKYYLFFKFTANGGHHNYSLFIIHYSLYKKSAVLSDNGH